MPGVSRLSVFVESEVWLAPSALGFAIFEACFFAWPVCFVARRACLVACEH
jgi:hypothetical protein